MDHDLDLVFSNPAEPAPIQVQRGDALYDPQFRGDVQFNFSRSKFTVKNGKRTFAN